MSVPRRTNLILVIYSNELLYNSQDEAYCKQIAKMMGISLDDLLKATPSKLTNTVLRLSQKQTESDEKEKDLAPQLTEISGFMLNLGVPGYKFEEMYQTEKAIYKPGLDTGNKMSCGSIGYCQDSVIQQLSNIVDLSKFIDGATHFMCTSISKGAHYRILSQKSSSKSHIFGFGFGLGCTKQNSKVCSIVPSRF